MSGSYLLKWLLMAAAGVVLAGCRVPGIAATAPPDHVPTTEIVFTTATPGALTTALATATAPVAETPQATATATTAPRNTLTLAPAASATPSPTRMPDVTPSPTTRVTPAPTATASSTPEAPSPVIHEFRLVSEEEINPGKRLTFTWSATGDSAMLVAGTRQRFIAWWVVPLSDTMTIELENTLFRDPGVSLTVSGPQKEDGTTGEQITETIVIPWACDHSYFFSPSPQRCPRDTAQNVPAAQQAFEGGRMVWLKPEHKIVVFFDAPMEGTDGMLLRVYEDTWTAGEPESDPAIEPPAGRYQPVRGFGKLWRTNPEVRDGLGWALAPESAFGAIWQYEHNESLGTTSYLRLADGRVTRVVGYDTGYGWWRTVDG